MRLRYSYCFGDGMIGRRGISLSLPIRWRTVAHLAPFNRELMFVVDVLVCASAAMAKIRALRCDAMRGVFLNFHQLRLGELFFFAHDLRRNEFALNGVRNEDSLPLLASDPFSAESNIFDFQIDYAHTNISTERIANANSILILTFFRHSSFVLRHFHYGLATSRTRFAWQDR